MASDFTKLYKRWSTGAPRKEEMMEETFILIDNDGLLNTEQKNTLYENAALKFELGIYKSLANILNTQHVEVHICKGIPERSPKLPNDYLKEFEEYWRAKLQSKYAPERAKAEKAIEAVKNESDYIKKTKLRGCYIPVDRIELYPEGYDVEHMNELLISTLAHEVMHAYFDRPGHCHYPYAYYVEEPLAEFGMLLYLQETGLLDILDWAKKDVANKRSCYHYGAVLYNQYVDWNPFLRRYLEEYKYNINKYEMLDVAAAETAIGIPFPFVHSISTASLTAKRLLFKYRLGKTESCVRIPNKYYNAPSAPFDSICKKKDSIKMVFQTGTETIAVGQNSTITTNQRFQYNKDLKDFINKEYRFKLATKKDVMIEIYETDIPLVWEIREG